MAPDDFLITKAERTEASYDFEVLLDPSLEAEAYIHPDFIVRKSYPLPPGQKADERWMMNDLQQTCLEQFARTRLSQPGILKAQKRTFKELWPIEGALELKSAGELADDQLDLELKIRAREQREMEAEITRRAESEAIRATERGEGTL